MRMTQRGPPPTLGCLSPNSFSSSTINPPNNGSGREDGKCSFYSFIFNSEGYNEEAVFLIHPVWQPTVLHSVSLSLYVFLLRFFLPAHRGSSDDTQRPRDAGDSKRKRDAVTVKGKYDEGFLHWNKKVTKKLKHVWNEEEEEDSAHHRLHNWVNLQFHVRVFIIC